MNIIYILWRNVKWRFQNPISIIITILQPMLWLILYSAVAGQAMKSVGIENYTAFILPGVIFLVTFSACSSGGMMNFIMKSSGGFYRILIAPISRSSIVLGQMFEAVLCTFIEVIILFIVSFFFSVKIASGIIGIVFIIILVFLNAFFLSGLSYAISLYFPSEVIYETIMTAIVLPIFFLSTALFPDNNLRGCLLIAINLNPFTHIINALRNLIFQKEVMLMDIFPVFALLITMCFASFSLAYWRLKKETTY